MWALGLSRYESKAIAAPGGGTKTTARWLHASSRSYGMGRGRMGDACHARWGTEAPHAADCFRREWLQRRRKGKAQHHNGTQPAKRASRTPGTTAQAIETPSRHPSGAKQGQAPKKCEATTQLTEQSKEQAGDGARKKGKKADPPREQETHLENGKPPQAQHTHISAPSPRTKTLQAGPRVPSRPGNTGSSYPTATPAR